MLSKTNHMQPDRRRRFYLAIVIGPLFLVRFCIFVLLSKSYIEARQQSTEYAGTGALVWGGPRNRSCSALHAMQAHMSASGSRGHTTNDVKWTEVVGTIALLLSTSSQLNEPLPERTGVIALLPNLPHHAAHMPPTWRQVILREILSSRSDHVVKIKTQTSSPPNLSAYQSLPKRLVA